MYTRIKSQKSGIQVGINKIANNTRARVLASSSLVNNDSKKILDVNNNGINNPISNPELNSVSMTTASVVLDNKEITDLDLNAVNSNPSIPMVSYVTLTTNNF